MAYKVFQNGFQLPASDLNNYLMNQSVITFANSTARSAAITSPVEGMLTYLEDTNSYEGWNGSAWTDINDNTGAIAKSLLTTAGDTIYATGASTPARLALGSTGSLLKSNGTAPAWLGVGTTGQVLSSTGSDLAWTTPATGGATLLSTTTLSGNSVNITGISAAYSTLRVILQGISLTAADYVNINAQNTPGGTLTFTGTRTYHYSSVPNIAQDNGARTTIGILGGFGSSAQYLAANNANNHIILDITNYSASTYIKRMSGGSYWTAQSAPTAQSSVFAGIAVATGYPIDKLNINANTGTTNFNGGTAYVFGLN